MKKLFKSVIAVFALSAPMLLSSCATIFSGGSPKITINGDVSEPVTITTTKQTYANVTLPAVVKVKRHKLDGQRIKITSENYTFDDIVLEKTVNGLTFGNIFIGGLVGLGIDLSTNCVSKPLKTEFTIQPQSK